MSETVDTIDADQEETSAPAEPKAGGDDALVQEGDIAA